MADMAIDELLMDLYNEEIISYVLSKRPMLIQVIKKR